MKLYAITQKLNAAFPIKCLRYRPLRKVVPMLNAVIFIRNPNIQKEITSKNIKLKPAIRANKWIRPEIGECTDRECHLI
jgi:hypothetical protein